MENHVKMLEKMILTTELGAKHLFVGCNTQQEFSTLGSFGSIFYKIIPQDYTISIGYSFYIFDNLKGTKNEKACGLQDTNFTYKNGNYTAQLDHILIDNYDYKIKLKDYSIIINENEHK